MTDRNTQHAGFTLLELMIVVAIIGLIAAIAIPNMLRSKVEANEASAIGDLRIIGAAEIAYHASNGTFADFEDLTLDDAGPGTSYLDDSWFQGREKAGYSFTVTAADTTQFVCFADPVSPGTTGTRFFRVDTAGIVRYNRNAQPTDNDPPVGS